MLSPLVLWVDLFSWALVKELREVLLISAAVQASPLLVVI
jgi:hypothetical protein